jgi:deoxyribose-phosphate aldolase
LICKEAGADFVKTSTGFSSGGATTEDIDLMQRVVGPEDQMGVKAAGGIHNFNDVISKIQAGADRIGTRLAVSILEEYRRGLLQNDKESQP